MHQEKSFHSLWEGYLFNVASLAIDSASPADQTRLIDAITLGSLSDPPVPSVEIEHQLTQGQAANLSTLAQLENQWRTALKNPLSPNRRCLEHQDILVRRWFLLNQQQIRTTQRQIDRLRGLIKRVKQPTATTPLQSHLLLQYEHLEARYTTYLGKLLVAQDDKATRHTLLAKLIRTNE